MLKQFNKLSTVQKGIALAVIVAAIAGGYYIYQQQQKEVRKVRKARKARRKRGARRNIAKSRALKKRAMLQRAMKSSSCGNGMLNRSYTISPIMGL